MEKEEPTVPAPNMGLQIPSEGNSWFDVNPGDANEQVSNPGDSWTSPQQL